MEYHPEILDFVKALSDAERLRIIGLLIRGPMNGIEIASGLGIAFPEAVRHLDHLVHGGILRLSDGRYRLDDANLEGLARRQFEGSRDTYTPAPNLDGQSRKVLAAYLNADGTLRQFPLQPGKLRVILEYVASAFTPGATYTEQEVNLVLRRFHTDVSALRRGLVDAGLFRRERDGSRYWRNA